jgi:Tfp pilus assembly protein PilV
MRKAKRYARGLTLTETAISILILSVVILGASFFFVYGTNQIHLRNNYRIATMLASEKIEQLKAGNYSDINEGTNVENVTQDDIIYTRTANVISYSDYKSVEVKTTWNRMNKQCEVTLNTLIAP